MKNLLTLSLILSLSFSCTQKDSDLPVIKSLLLSSSNIQKSDGAILEFTYEFTDDEGLNKFRVSVLDIFEDARLQSAPWNYERDFDLSGVSAVDTVQIGLPYPDLEAGRYELTVTVQDIDGGETVQKRTFFINE